jgi:hypothetical protein
MHPKILPQTPNLANQVLYWEAFEPKELKVRKRQFGIRRGDTPRELKSAQRTCALRIEEIGCRKFAGIARPL